MTIDEAIEAHKKYEKLANERKKGVRNQEVVKIQMGLASYHSQIAEWLEELKFLRTTKETMFREIYNQALEDALNVVEWDGYTLDIKERIEKLKK